MSQPVPVHHFMVDWGGARIGFTEVSGLEVEAQTIEYREGSSPTYSVTKMPGLKKYSNVTLKRGIFEHDNDFADWFGTIASNTVERRDVTISLLDHEHNPTMTWRLRNAWPAKLVGPTLDATSSAVAIEELQIAHEGLSVENG